MKQPKAMTTGLIQGQKNNQADIPLAFFLISQ